MTWPLLSPPFLPLPLQIALHSSYTAVLPPKVPGSPTLCPSCLAHILPRPSHAHIIPSQHTKTEPAGTISCYVFPYTSGPVYIPFWAPRCHSTVSLPIHLSASINRVQVPWGRAEDLFTFIILHGGWHRTGASNCLTNGANHHLSNKTNL